ncbi:MAG: phytoene desaturase family protein [Verrucomicrobiae bacterium]|nr:phytoene desaturase family protein [Verrucomicrobiae bacterium]
MPKTAIIIGAGLGGMATAIRLAREGWDVKVLEKNSRVGGKLTCASEAGFLWDVGPSVVNMPYLIKDLFDFAGQDIDNYLELVSLDPIRRCFFSGQKTMNAWANEHHFRIELARREKDHGESFEKFMKHARKAYELSCEAHLSAKCSGNSLFKRLPNVSKVLNARSMASQIKRYFKVPQVQQFFGHYATQIGSSPCQAPAMFNAIPFLEMRDGGWYVRGGLFHLAEALERCALELGVKFLFDAEVTEISTRGEKRFAKPVADGVLLRAGLRFDAEVVVCNTDVMHAWMRLIQHAKKAGVVRKLEKQPASPAPFIMLMGVRHRYEQLAHHNVFFSGDQEAEFNDLFLKKRPPEDPTVHLTISARTDPTQSPAGQDNYMAYVNMPALEPDHHWDQLRDICRNQVLDKLEKMGLPGLRKHIICEKLITPADFSAGNNSYRGMVYGQAMHSMADVFNRPPNRCKQIKNLYFVGGTVQPGGGIPMSLLSAQHVAELIGMDFSG